MHARKLTCQSVKRIALLIFVPLIGCGDTAPVVDSSSAPYMASGGGPRTSDTTEVVPPGVGLQIDSSGQPDTDVVTPQIGSQAGSQVALETENGHPTESGRTEPPQLHLADPQTGSNPQPTLPSGLSTKRLRSILEASDYNLRLLSSGKSEVTDPKQGRARIIEFINNKLEASRQLATHAEASQAEKSEGARGELQAMSHLASLGYVKVAEKLEQVARENLTSDDLVLASDSRLILVGFALEALKNGDENAPERIVAYFKQQGKSEIKPDVPTLMILGMAREDLADAGYENQAQQMREMILEYFADSPEPAIAEMAARLAGNVTFETIEKQRAALVNGEDITLEQWKKSVLTLIAESADLQTVQYLVGAALEFEGLKREDLVNATYQALRKAFTDQNSATTQEINIAMEARQARQNIIGKKYPWNFPKTDGTPLLISNYSGKVVLMPFWAQGFPPSLSIVPQLKAIRDAHPDRVAIVGVNLDPEGSDVQSFLNQSQLGFVSFRSESSPTAAVVNQAATDFGMVSLPFVAILDAKGQVHALNFTGQNLDDTVTALLKQ